ncbi:MAG: hypothetical protein IPM14_05095 [bacterium]|nr:hypothetical protein [bacterium]
MNSNYETNIFPILNLSELHTEYSLFEIIGINKELEEYDSNIQHIIKKLSYTLRHPVTVIKVDEQPHLVIKSDEEVAKKVPTEFGLIRNQVYFKPIGVPIKLNYLDHSSENKEICKRFLGFEIQSALYRDKRIWQPGSGKPYFQYKSKIEDRTALFNGFIVRVVELQDLGYGVTIDTTKKYTSSVPFNPTLSRDDFKRQQIKGKHVIYHHPNGWYEIKIEEISDLNVGNYKYQRNSKLVTLIDDLRSSSFLPHSPELANLPPDASIFFYKDNQGNHKAAPAGLCYVIFDTQNQNVGKLHRKSIMEPYDRRDAILACRNYLQNIKFGDDTLIIGTEPVKCKKTIFLAPDIKFGKDQIVSVRNSENAISIPLEKLGKTRKLCLENREVGFYNQRLFDRQFFILPKSIHESMGLKFLSDLKRTTDTLYPCGGGYDPIIISYEDRERRNYVDVGFEIIKAVTEQKVKASTSYGVVMIPDYHKTIRKHDELSALVVRELLSQDIHVGIIHTSTIEKSYEHFRINGENIYKVKPVMKGKLRGYLNNVAINKILLINNRWPYILATPLNADLIIGIDVKHNTAGYTFIDKYGENIRTEYQLSKQKEKLNKKQVYNFLKRKIAEEAALYNYPIKNIVVHRDGRIFETERSGIFHAIDELKSNMILPSDCEVNLVEIPKNSAIPFRIFDLKKEGNKNIIQNPHVGSYYLINNEEAFLCSTGREFPHLGTANPLYIKYNYGNMEFIKILEDIYFLTILAYSKPDDCSRYPLTIKITDRKLSEVASEYDEEELNQILEEESIERYE